MSGRSAVPGSLLKYLYDMLTVSQESGALCACVCVPVREKCNKLPPPPDPPIAL